MTKYDLLKSSSDTHDKLLNNSVYKPMLNNLIFTAILSVVKLAAKCPCSGKKLDFTFICCRFAELRLAGSVCKYHFFGTHALSNQTFSAATHRFKFWLSFMTNTIGVLVELRFQDFLLQVQNN